ncbi:uncharacterized protein LOC143468296 isoform X2 [Clavelina lepadiformis]|uniref:uncharacterized protein LOC143468296 isoform X2 n=1 Tax=Clavelina lepadiformis TaxID=159417 RepID=UPI0040434968
MLLFKALLLVFCKGLLSQTAGGLSEAVTRTSTCPDVCKDCPSHMAQVSGFVETDISSNSDYLHGCTVGGYTENNQYIERHMIRLKNDKVKKVYLILNKDDTTLPQNINNITEKYRFALTSLKPINWIVYHNLPATYDISFYILHSDIEKSIKPTIMCYRTGEQLVPKTIIRLPNSAVYNARQFRSVVASTLFHDKRLATYAELDNADVINLHIGRLQNSVKCIVKSEAAMPKTSLFQAFQRNPIIPLESCFIPNKKSANNFNGSLTYIVKVSSQQSQKTIQIELDEVYNLQENVRLNIVLYATGSVRWKIASDMRKKISAHLRFLIHENNSIVADDLVLSQNLSYNYIQIEGKSLLDELNAQSPTPANTYVKLEKSVDFVRLSFPSSDSSFSSKRKAEAIETYLHPLLMKTVRRCGIADMKLILPMETILPMLKDLDATIDDMGFGNGKCKISMKGNHSLEVFADQNCGLIKSVDQRTGERILIITMKMLDAPFRCKPSEIQLQLYSDISCRKKVVSPISSLDKNANFFVEMSWNSTDFDVKLESCYLQSDLKKRLLVRDNCPASGSVRFIIPHNEKDIKKQIFSFDPTEDLEYHDSMEFSISCNVSNCIDGLSKCPNIHGIGCSQDGLEHQRIINTTRVSVVTQLYAVGLQTKDTRSIQSGIELHVVVIIAFACFVMGIMLIFFIWHIDKHFQRNSKSDKLGDKSLYTIVSQGRDSAESLGYCTGTSGELIGKHRKEKFEKLNDQRSSSPLIPCSSKEQRTVQVISKDGANSSSPLVDREKETKAALIQYRQKASDSCTSTQSETRSYQSKRSEPNVVTKLLQNVEMREDTV